MTTNEYFARARKVERIIAAMDRLAGHQISALESTQFTREQWDQILSGINPPSDATLSMIAEVLTRRDAEIARDLAAFPADVAAGRLTEADARRIPAYELERAADPHRGLRIVARGEKRKAVRQGNPPEAA